MSPLAPSHLSSFTFTTTRVAELITAYGRRILRLMRDIASSKGFTAIAGDTYSLFLDGGNDGRD